jgi:hypothetical protein
MNSKLKSAVGFLCAVALTSGVAHALPNTLDLNPNSLLLGDTAPPIAPFTTAGGDAGVYMGMNVSDTTSLSGVVFSAWGSMQVNYFKDATLTNFLGNNTNGNPQGTGLNFDSAQGWQMFMTVHVGGTGGWSPAGTFSTDNVSSVTLNLWAVQGGSTASFDSTSPGNQVSLTEQTNIGENNFSNMGIDGVNVGDAILLAKGTAIAGNSFLFTDKLTGTQQEDEWLLQFTLALQMTAEAGAGNFFSGAPGFDLFIRSGCVEFESNSIPLDKENATTFRTPNNGESTCNNNGDNRDKVLWDLGATEVHEPMALSLLGFGLVGLSAMVRRRRQ